MHPGTRIVVDTCVWLDMYFGMRAKSAEARAFFDCAIERDVVLLYSINTVKDLHYLIPHILKRLACEQEGSVSEEAADAACHVAWACIDQMTQIATAVPCDMSDVWVARNLQPIHADFEDNLVIAAARRAKADFLVTDDKKLLGHAPLAAKTPAQMRAIIEAEV